MLEFGGLQVRGCTAWRRWRTSVVLPVRSGGSTRDGAGAERSPGFSFLGFNDIIGPEPSEKTHTT